MPKILSLVPAVSSFARRGRDVAEHHEPVQGRRDQNEDVPNLVKAELAGHGVRLLRDEDDAAGGVHDAGSVGAPPFTTSCLRRACVIPTSCQLE